MAPAKRRPLRDTKIAKPLKHANGDLAEKSGNSPDPKAAGLFLSKGLGSTTFVLLHLLIG